MGEDSPPPIPTSEFRVREKSSKEDKNTTEVRKSVGRSAPQKGAKKFLVPKDSASEENSTVTSNAAALGSVIAEALKSSFEGLRDSINAGFTGLAPWLSRKLKKELDDANGDSNGSKDDGESLVEGEPPGKAEWTNPGKNRNPLISKLSKTLQLAEHVGPAIDGDFACLVD